MKSQIPVVVKNLPPGMQETKETWVQSLGLDDTLEEGMATTPIFLLGESRGQRSLVDYSPWGHKESDTTECLTFSLSFIIFILFYTKKKKNQ